MLGFCRNNVVDSSPKTYLAFDFGTKKIGVAVGQSVTMTANPIDTIAASDWQHIGRVIQQWQPDALIVGVPLNMDGTAQPITRKAKQFLAELQNRTGLPVYGIDERLTTVEARQMLYELGGYKALQKISVDSFAAKLMLESWMRSNLKREP
jgi:putative Holliday junction resolvase